jgi:GNAT superfamily N-acetyltransferase
MDDTFTDADKAKCARREAGKRIRVYPRLVEKRDMKQADADREIAMMQAIAADYERLAAMQEKAPAQRSLLGPAVDILGPIPLGQDAFLRKSILGRLRAAQEIGEMPPRHEPPHDDSSVIWIGPAGNPFAFATFYEVYPKVAWLDLLHVHRDHRRYGYGSMLLQTFEQILRAERFISASLGTATGNERLQRLAARLGWQAKGIVMERKI